MRYFEIALCNTGSLNTDHKAPVDPHGSSAFLLVAGEVGRMSSAGTVAHVHVWYQWSRYIDHPYSSNADLENTSTGRDKENDLEEVTWKQKENRSHALPRRGSGEKLVGGGVFMSASFTFTTTSATPSLRNKVSVKQGQGIRLEKPPDLELILN